MRADRTARGPLGQLGQRQGRQRVDLWQATCVRDSQRAARAAELVWDAWCTGKRIDGLPAGLCPTEAVDGMAAQAALEELAGAGYGWKIAATSAAGQAHIAVDGPLPGRLFERFRYAAGDRLPSHDLHMRVAEGEFAFEMAADLDPAHEHTLDEVMAAVAAMYLAIEVPDSRFTDFVGAGVGPVMADDGYAGRFVLGAEVPGWQELDLAKAAVLMHVNGAVAGRGGGGNVLGDPRRALHWMAGELPRLGRRLRVGDIVTTGTTTVPPRIGPGDSVTADFGELGTVSITFAR